MNRMPKFGSKVMGGDIPILGQPRKKVKEVGRLASDQMLNNFLFDIAFGTVQYLAMIELKIEALADEMNVDFDISEEVYQKRVEALLPQTMEAFGLIERGENEGKTNETN